jgi:polyisoprenoid-binding protein YceI
MSSLPPKEILKMRYRLSSFAPALMALTFAVVASADSYEVVVNEKEKVKPSLEFYATATGGLKINGTADQLTAIEKDGKLIFKAPLTNVKTGIGLRDNHTKKYLGTDKFPAASLTVEKSAIKTPEDGKTSEGTVPAKFHVHGVPLDVTVKYSAKRAGSIYDVVGSFEVKDITKHNIEHPCYLGVCMNKSVLVKVAFKLKAK